MTGIELIAEERKRQIEKEGFNAEHDEENGLGILGSAALCYLEHAIERAWLIDEIDDGIDEYTKEEVPGDWPAAWATEWWKPKDPIKDLVRAGALIAAEIDNRLRKKGFQSVSQGCLSPIWGVAEMNRRNKDLIDFVDSILNRYNATPDEWDAFESVKWSMDTTHKISAVFSPQRNEVEATWENIATGKTAGATFPVTPDQGEDIAELIMPCVYHDAACEPPDSKLWERISELEVCISQMCNNALDLGYCDMSDCHDCKTFKVRGIKR